MAIREFTVYPQSTDPPGEFANNGDVWIKEVSTRFIPDANALATDVNAKSVVATEQAAIATAQAGIASAATNAVNYKGEWSSLSGALNIPASVYHNGNFWVLLSSLADITLSEPSPINTDWSEATGDILTGKTFLQSKYDQIADATISTGTHTFNYSLGDMQQVTATGDFTLAFSNFPAGKISSMIIDAINFGAHTITHPATMIFTAGIAPYYTVAGTDRLMVIKDKDEVYSLFVIGRNIKVVA